MKFIKPKISISLQISVFLVLVAFIPVIVMMALNTYEKQLLELSESASVQEARLVSAALESSGNNSETAVTLLKNMKGRFVSRIRILDEKGALLADSSTINVSAASKGAGLSSGIESSENDAGTEAAPTGTDTKNALTVSSSEGIEVAAEDSLVYRIFSLPIRIYRKLFRRPVQSLYDTADFYNGKNLYDGEEIKEALSGRYGAVTRISSGDQVSVTLYSAVPVFDGNNGIAGAVLVSRSTYRILRNLYELRKDMAMVFLRSLIAVCLVAVFFAFRITFPLKKLSRQASDCADKKGRIFFTRFTGSRRLDEIGELSRSFTSLIERLNKRIQFSQAFSSDISHEFKNPLAAIRSSAEVLEDSDLEENDRKELSSAIVDEVTHLEMLLSGVRNISKIDAGENLSSEKIPVFPFLENMISRLKKKYPETEFVLKNDCEKDFSMKIPEDYFSRLSENLIDNAASFGNKVFVTVSVKDGKMIFSVEDNGKGVDEASVEKIFSRFYSDRPEKEKGNHTGLGLSTVKAITDSLEGEISVGKSKMLGGADFTVKIPFEK